MCNSNHLYVMPQCVAVCCSVFAEWCSVLQFVAVCCDALQCVTVCASERGSSCVCRSVLWCVAVYCRVLPCVAACCSMLQCVQVKSTKQCVQVENTNHGCNHMCKCIDAFTCVTCIHSHVYDAGCISMCNTNHICVHHFALNHIRCNSYIVSLIGLFCKRALYKKLYSAKETYSQSSETHVTCKATNSKT